MLAMPVGNGSFRSTSEPSWLIRQEDARYSRVSHYETCTNAMITMAATNISLPLL